jgi:hypothetical protein
VPAPKPATVEAYLDRLPEGHRAALAGILACLREEFPGLEARLAWNVPHLYQGKDPVVGLSSAKGHVAFSPWSAAALAAHRGRLGGLEATANLIRIPPGWKPDKALLASLVRARLAELRAPSGQAPRKRAAKPE